MKIQSQLLLVLFIPLLISTGKVKNKHAALLKLAKDNSPTAYAILNRVNGFKFEKYADGNSYENLVDDFDIVVHESLHHLNHQIGQTYCKETSNDWICEGYFIAPDINIAMKQVDVFNSIELNDFVPDSLQKNIFRYEEYVGKKRLVIWNASQMSGIYGMLNEMTAYYHDVKAKMELYDYFKTNRCNGYKDEEAWVSYIGWVSNSHFAYYEFRLFISWYLQYAKTNHPDVYQNLMNEKRLRVAFTLVDDSFNQLIRDYYTMRQNLITELNKEGEQVKIIKSEFMGSYVMAVYDSNGGYTGSGIFEDEIIMLKKLLSQKEHQILDTFRLEGVTRENFEQFFD
jgi:hypothetical protein